MFGLFGDMARDIAGAVGTVTGTILAVPVAVVAETMGITVEMVKEAKEAGCETYEQIREYFFK